MSEGFDGIVWFEEHGFKCVKVRVQNRGVFSAYYRHLLLMQCNTVKSGSKRL